MFDGICQGDELDVDQDIRHEVLVIVGRAGVLGGTALCSTVLCSIVLCSTVLCSIVLCSTVLCSTDLQRVLVIQDGAGC